MAKKLELFKKKVQTIKEPDKCNCSARLMKQKKQVYRAIFEDTYSKTYDTAKTGPVDVLVLLEFQETNGEKTNSPFPTTYRQHNLIQFCKKYLAHTNYAIRTALGCTPYNFSGTDTIATYSTCKHEHVKKIIHELQPKVIITTGRAIYSITESKSLRPEHFYINIKNKLPGSVDDTWFWSSEFNCKVFPVPPMYQWCHPAKKIDGSYRTYDVYETEFTKEQFFRARASLKEPRQRTRQLEYHLITDSNTFLRTLIDNPEITEIAIDTETGGFNYFTHELFTIQFAFNEYAGYLLYWRDINKDLLIELFDKKKIIIMQNAQFDLRFLIRNGIHNAYCTIDTKILKNCLNENSPTGLKPMSWVYTKFGGYDKESDEYFKKHDRKDFIKLPPDIFLRYGCTDAIVTYIIYKYLMYRLSLEDEITQNNFYNVRMRAVSMLVRLEMRGMRLDRKYMSEYCELLRQKTIDFEQEIFKLAEKEINVNSGKQLTEVLEMIMDDEDLIDAEYNDDGTMKFSKEHIDNFDTEKYPILAKIQEYKSARKELSQLEDPEVSKKYNIKKSDMAKRQKFLSPFVIQKPEKEKKSKKQTGFYFSMYNNFLHSGFNLDGTETGRMSSSGGLGSSINFQNMTKGMTFRKVFLPSYDHVLLEMDYNAMEVRQSSQIAGPGGLEKMILEGKEPHSIMATSILKELNRKNPDTGEFYTYDEFYYLAKKLKIEEFVNIRDNAKGTFFLALYNGTAYGLSSNLGIELEQAELFLNTFFKEFPEYRMYIDRQIRHASNYGYVRSLTGKKRRLPPLTYRGNFKDVKAARGANISNLQNASVNAPVQGSSGETTIISMTNIDLEFIERGLKSRICNNVHDSIVVDCYVPEIDIVTEIMTRLCTKPYYENTNGNKVKLSVEIKLGEVWGYGEELKYWKENPKEFEELRQRINQRNIDNGYVNI